MTPFALVVSWTGRSIAPREAEQLLDPVSDRCGDGRTSVSVPGAALAVGLRIAGRNDTLASGFTVDKNEGWVAAGDVRLYDRDRLVETLGRDFADATDISLLARVYRRHGESVLAGVVGDFALVIWDWRRRSVHAIRDHFGLRLLYSRQTSDGMAFGSDAHQLLGATESSPQVDPHAALDYLLAEFTTRGNSFFSGIDSLTPGHYLTATPATSSVRRYWRPSSRMFNGTYSQAVEEWRDRFRTAVRSRLESAHSVACYLSGGIDSSAIVGAAHDVFSEGSSRNKQALTLSALFPGFACDEGRYSEAVSRRCRTFQSFSWDGTEPNADDFDSPAASVPGLREGIGRSRRRELMAVRASNRRILFSGGGGDSLSWSHGVLLDLATRGKLTELLRQLAATGSWRRALRAVRTELRSRWPKRWYPSPPIWLAAGLRQAFANRAGEMPRSDKHGFSHVQSNVWAILSSPRASSIVEMEVRAAAEAGAEMRMPYLDIRLVEWSLSLPWELRLPNGDPRRLQRDAVRPFVPQVVGDRTDKAAFGAMAAHQVRQNLTRIGDMFRTGPWMSQPFVDRASILATLNLLKDRDPAVSRWRDWNPVWKAAVFEAWLRRGASYGSQPKRV